MTNSCKDSTSDPTSNLRAERGKKGARVGEEKAASGGAKKRHKVFPSAEKKNWSCVDA